MLSILLAISLILIINRFSTTPKGNIENYICYGDCIKNGVFNTNDWEVSYTNSCHYQDYQAYWGGAGRNYNIPYPTIDNERIEIHSVFSSFAKCLPPLGQVGGGDEGVRINVNLKSKKLFKYEDIKQWLIDYSFAYDGGNIGDINIKYGGVSYSIPHVQSTMVGTIVSGTLAIETEHQFLDINKFNVIIDGKDVGEFVVNENGYPIEISLTGKLDKTSVPK